VVEVKCVNIKSRKPIAPIVVESVFAHMEDVGVFVKNVTVPEFVFIRSVEHYAKNVVVPNAARVQDARRVEIENMICIVCFVRCILDRISRLPEITKLKSEL
jgi:hypothetical protein